MAETENGMRAASAAPENIAVKAHSPQAKSSVSVAEVIARARDELEGMTGCKVDCISGFEKVDGGWHITVSVLELHRIPAATDVLAKYEVRLNEIGNILSYHRDKRYYRDQVGEDQ